MRWGDFLKLMNDAGVQHSDEINYIEIDPLPDGKLHIDRRKNADDTYTISVYDMFDS